MSLTDRNDKLGSSNSTGVEPMKVKIFTKMNKKNKVEPANSEYEAEINEWLVLNPSIEIRHIQQSAGGGSQGPFIFCITVWYDERK